jgi:hypothetical protein
MFAVGTEAPVALLLVSGAGVFSGTIVICGLLSAIGTSSFRGLRERALSAPTALGLRFSAMGNLIRWLW